MKSAVRLPFLVVTGILFALVVSGCGASEPKETAKDVSAPAVDSAAAAAPTAVIAEEPTAVTAPPTASIPTPRPSPKLEPATAASPQPAPALPGTTGTGDEKLAAELAGISGWINAEPFTIESQRGSVVLIDFWTYTCINCIRTFPFLKEWHQKYAGEGLIIIGVHTPEFEFEKDRDNVVQATGEFGIEYAVVQDNDYATWNAYNNRFWPAKYLIDKDGYVRYTHFGEGDYAETELKIRELLSETGATVFDITPNDKPGPTIHPEARSATSVTTPTRELYAGLERNLGALNSGGTPPYVAHAEYYSEPNTETLYEDPGEHRNQFIYLHGLWRNDLESLTHARETDDYQDYIAILFYATTVNVVMMSEGGDSYEVRVTMDDLPLDTTQAGANIRFDGDGNSYVFVDEPRMYRLVELPEYGGHELKLSSNSLQFSVFAYTFGVYETERES